MGSEGKVIDQRLILLRRHWQQHPRALYSDVSTEKPRPRLTIAISREAGAPGSQVAHAIGKQLDWPVYDREILDLIAQKSRLRTELVESLDEHDCHWLQETLTAIGHPGELGSAGYFYHLKQVLATLAAHGKCIIVGRGATSLLPPKTTLRVRIIAPLEQRVSQIALESNLSQHDAEKQTHQIDYDRAQFSANHFHTDINDSHNFDLVLNASRLTPSVCAEIAIQAVKSGEQEMIPQGGLTSRTTKPQRKPPAMS